MRKNKKDRKLLQLCAQIKRCLILATPDSDEELVRDLEVLEVMPNPNAGRLMVYVNHSSASREDILGTLKRVKGELRCAVAEAISRKRVPELAFEIMPRLVVELTKPKEPKGTKMEKKMPRNYDVMCGDKAGHSPIKMWTRDVEVEDTAKEQLYNMSQMPFIHKHIAVMPDCHWGNGACVGSVIPTVGAIIPAAVGVDLGCGVMAQRTSLTSHDLPENLRSIRSLIEKNVPHGRTDNGGRRDRGAWGNPPCVVDEAWTKLEFDFELICEKHPKVARSNHRHHLGTLGGGNHFVELCLDEEDRIWVMLHSGSRGVGNRIGSYFIELAKNEMKRWFINLPDMNLAYIAEGSEHFDDYVEAVDWAQRFALTNRELMMAATIEAIQDGLQRPFDLEETAVNCHHNYITKEHHFNRNVWVTRKGAVRAREGDLGIIPGSMGAKSFIVRGKGNDESFHSCSHGAGRKMSRTAARKKFSVDDHIQATKGVECRKDADVIDETPGAYKNIASVMAAQSDLVEVMHTLKQIICVKG